MPTRSWPGSPQRWRNGRGPEFGDTGLAKAHRFHNPVRLIAASTGASRGDAAKLIAVGTATAERRSFGGERIPSKHPHVAAALAAAAISVEAAAAITSMSTGSRSAPTRPAPSSPRPRWSAWQPGPRSRPFSAGCARPRRASTKTASNPEKNELRQGRSLTIREDGNGLIHLHARLDPETAAPVKAAIEALVTDVLRRRERTPGDDGPALDGPVLDDTRSIPQLQADALAALARRTLGCSQTLTPLAKTTVVVRMDRKTLLDGVGHARIDGIDQPISAATARRMAADAELIPAVLGGDSLPLDLGRARPATSAAHNDSPSPNATAAAHPAGRTSATSKHTTSTGGIATPAPPTSPTGSCSAASATTSCTAKPGASAPPQTRSGSSHPHTSTPNRHPDSEDEHDSNPTRQKRRENAAA